MLGFEKNDRANVTVKELEALKAMDEGILVEVPHDLLIYKCK